eukprot:175909-Chlamydomonas_euryale.AAC.2
MRFLKNLTVAQALSRPALPHRRQAGLCVHTTAKQAYIATELSAGTVLSAGMAVPPATNTQLL